MYKAFIVFVFFLAQTNGEECNSYQADITPGPFMGYMSSRMATQPSRGVEKAYDKNIQTFAQTECSNNKFNPKYCSGVGFNFLDNNYAWFILYLSNAALVKSVSITTTDIDLIKNVDVLVTLYMTRYPAGPANSAYGFSGVDWSVFTSCGNTGNTNANTTIITCGKAQKIKFVALRRYQTSLYDYRHSLYISEINLQLYQASQNLGLVIDAMPSSSGIWSESSSSGQSVSACTLGSSRNFKYKWYQEYFDGTSKLIGETSTNTLSLTPVTRKNAGKYYVRYFSKINNQLIATSKKSKNIYVKCDPELKKFDVNKNIYHENEFLIIICEADSGYPFQSPLKILIENSTIPQADIQSVTTNNKYGLEETKTTVKTKVVKNMNKKYVECKFTKHKKQVEDQRKFIEVYYNSTITSFKVNKFVLNESETLTVNCISSPGYPQFPIVDILRGNDVIRLSDKKNISDLYGGQSQSVKLSINATKEWNGKSIHCKLIQNDRTTESSRIKLEVHYKADIIEVKSSNESIYLFSSVKMICELKSRGFPTADVIWKHNDTEMDEMRNKTEITINNATLSDAGIYNCITKNNAGVDAKSKFLAVKLRPTTRVNNERSTPATQPPVEFNSTWAIISVSVGGVIVVVLVIVFSVLACRRYRRPTVERPYPRHTVEYNCYNDVETTSDAEASCREHTNDNYRHSVVYGDTECKHTNDDYRHSVVYGDAENDL